MLLWIKVYEERMLTLVALKKENNPSRQKRKVFKSKNFQNDFFKAVSKDFYKLGAKAQSDEY
jgi:hypothetical protein